MKGVVVNTDYDWWCFLRQRSPLEEVNFWQPSGKGPFHTEQPGTPFFFRLKSPYNAIAGFGIFARAAVLPAWLAWDCFREANGAPDFTQFIRRIEQYRREGKRDPHGRYDIGCLMLAQPVFFDERDWVAQPRDWSSQIVVGRHQELSEGEGLRIYQACLDRVQRNAPSPPAEPSLLLEPGEARRYGEPVLVRPRLGQGTFRIAVTDAYRRACAVTREHSLPALEAAHIKPFSEGGENAVRNGILLRSDIHRLFDKGYVTVTKDLHFEVSRRLKEDYENGRSYYPLHGRPVCVPSRPHERPDPEALDWHASHVFLG